jgi:hypothetical protein
MGATHRRAAVDTAEESSLDGGERGGLGREGTEDIRDGGLAGWLVMTMIAMIADGCYRVHWRTSMIAEGLFLPFINYLN